MGEGSDGIATAVEAPVAGIVDELVPGAHATRANVSTASAPTAPPGRAYVVDRVEAWRIAVRG
jgi:hypothetical protein